MAKKPTFREEVTRATVRAIITNGYVCPDCGRTVPKDKQALVDHAEGIHPDCNLRSDIADTL
jgi:DNA-directed RNA polymerase subunit RPC12/RpoP